MTDDRERRFELQKDLASALSTTYPCYPERSSLDPVLSVIDDMTDEQATMEQAARAITDLMAQGRRRWSQVTPLLIVETLNMAGLLRQPVDGDTSDGYHTFGELYKFRLLYNAALFNEWAAQGKYDVHKSKRHSDGELCFGGEGWFIVVAQLPTGQISNHYELSEWDLFDVPSRLLAAEWDGHTSTDVTQRLYDLDSIAQDRRRQGGENDA